MKKKQEAKFQILFMEKFQKIQEAQFENLTHENLAFLLGDVQPKMCGINFPKNTKLLSVVIKNKQSCYQLLSCKYQ